MIGRLHGEPLFIHHKDTKGYYSLSYVFRYAFLYNGPHPQPSPVATREGASIIESLPGFRAFVSLW